MGGVINLPILNTQSGWSDLQVEAVNEGGGGGLQVEVVPPAGGYGGVAGGQQTHLPVMLRLVKDPNGSNNGSNNGSKKKRHKPLPCPRTPTTVTLRIYPGSSPDAATDPATDPATAVGALQHMTLRCREPHQSFLYSFMDHDGSPSRAAAVAPPGWKAPRSKPSNPLNATGKVPTYCTYLLSSSRVGSLGDEVIGLCGVT